MAKLMVFKETTLYTKFVTVDNGQYVLYVYILKALYGLIKSALLFYKKLVKVLKEIGFNLNPYDPCVVNRIVNSK